MDGTLVDSEELHWQAWRETMQAEGRPITREEFLASFGQRNDRILATWLGEACGPDRVRRLSDSKEECYRAQARKVGLVPLPGAAEWVEKLRGAGWRQAMATAAPRANAECILELLGFNDRFEAVVTAEDVRHGKPDPEVFLAAAAKLGVPPAQCIVVEDAAAGTEAARRAGMRSIGVRRPGPPIEADIVVDSLADLPPDAFDRLVPAR